MYITHYRKTGKKSKTSNGTPLDAGNHIITIDRISSIHPITLNINGY